MRGKTIVQETRTWYDLILIYELSYMIYLNSFAVHVTWGREERKAEKQLCTDRAYHP